MFIRLYGQLVKNYYIIEKLYIVRAHTILCMSCKTQLVCAWTKTCSIPPVFITHRAVFIICRTSCSPAITYASVIYILFQKYFFSKLFTWHWKQQFSSPSVVTILYTKHGSYRAPRSNLINVMFASAYWIIDSITIYTNQIYFFCFLFFSNTTFLTFNNSVRLLEITIQ